MPGLLRGVARTAVVAGTATAVSNRVTRRQRGRWAAQQGYAYQEPEPRYARYAPSAQPPQAAEPAAAPASDMGSTIDRLKQLGELKAQGVITEAEFEEQKHRLLG
ncbi:SHOCT domain-containing protein [Streptomyces griseus]|uniref:SHOCT domain-containing protein n=1 Tax=Streptomyces griseus TaxID=1911 RepID=UPI000561FA68|nr:SHOCT domain-containing protein [Streptomyces griseus]